MKIEPFTARRILERHRLANKYRAQALELSNERLAIKMRTGRVAVSMIANGNEPPKSHGLDHNDVRLIRSCISERDRLRTLIGDNTPQRMAAEYHLPLDTVNDLIHESEQPRVEPAGK